MIDASGGDPPWLPVTPAPDDTTVPAWLADRRRQRYAFEVEADIFTSPSSETVAALSFIGSRAVALNRHSFARARFTDTETTLQSARKSAGERS